MTTPFKNHNKLYKIELIIHRFITQLLPVLNCTLPCRPAKGSLMSPPVGPPAPKPGRVASVVAGRVSSARPFCPPTEPAILSGISRGWLRVLCWAIMPVIRVARPSWVRTLNRISQYETWIYFWAGLFVKDFAQEQQLPSVSPGTSSTLTAEIQAV